jgi:hypothetical protein
VQTPLEKHAEIDKLEEIDDGIAGTLSGGEARRTSAEGEW